MVSEIDEHNNETYQLILDVAGELFSKRGYSGVTLRDIANAVGMRQASLYYYAPKGKEQLFVEVMKRNYMQHRQGLEKVISEAGPNLIQRLQAIAGWLLSQPPVDYTRLNFSDVPAIDPVQAELLIYNANSSLADPIKGVLEDALQQGIMVELDSEVAANGFIMMIEGLHNVPTSYTKYTRSELANQLIQMITQGWLKR